MNVEPVYLVKTEFWQLIASNDFFSVGAILSTDFLLDWPQSGERIRGAENFARMNSEYPANGVWRFKVNSIVVGATSGVSDVSVTDGVQRARHFIFYRSSGEDKLHRGVLAGANSGAGQSCSRS